MSFTATFLPIIAILGCIEQFLDIQAPWQPINYQQVTLLHRYYPQKDQLNALKSSELISKASCDVNDINQFLREHNFSMQLQPEANSVCYAASILDILVHWQYKGEKTSLYVENQEYTGIQLKKGYSLYQIPGYPHELIKIETDSHDQVYMTLADTPCQSFELLETIRILTNHPLYSDISDEYEDLIFPMVDLNQEVDISWLENMYIPGHDAKTTEMWIAKAIQQTKFQMNENGAAAQSAVGVAMVTRVMPMPKPSYIIDKPFYLWIMRRGISIPLFAGYINTDDWKEPARLSD